MNNYSRAYDNGYYAALVDFERRINAVLQGQDVTTASREFLATAVNMFRGMIRLRLQSLDLSKQETQTMAKIEA